MAWIPYFLCNYEYVSQEKFPVIPNIVSGTLMHQAVHQQLKHLMLGLSIHNNTMVLILFDTEFYTQYTCIEFKLTKILKFNWQLTSNVLLHLSLLRQG